MRGLLYVLIFFSGLVLAVLSIRAQKQGRIQMVVDNGGKRPDIFEIAAWYLYQIICVRFLSGNRKGSFVENILQAPQVKRDLRALNPDARSEFVQAKYYVQKIKWFLMLFYIGDLLAFVIHISGLTGETIYQNRYIDRKAYGEGQTVISAKVKTLDGLFSKEMQLAVEEIELSEEELNELYANAVAELKSMSSEKVCESLDLPTFLEGYPFELEWESNNYFVMNHQGEIQKEEISVEGEPVLLTCHFLYREWQKDFEIPLLIFPKEKTPGQIWEQQIEEVLLESEKEQKEEATFILPDKIGDKEVIWEEIKEDYSLVILILFLLTSCCIYILQDRDLHQKTEERNARMLAEYPVLVNRMTLYLGAGMTIKSAWNKIAKDYRERKNLLGEKNYTYEEMLFTCYEMQSGISECNSYERFGKRCGLQPYTRLIGLLNQSLKKGNASLVGDLQREAEAAQDARRNEARKKGEEAGTKLLLPMMMMLGIVMVLVMIPAFFSFSM